MKKTNAIRILEAAHIPFTLHSYPWDEEHLDAVTASSALDVEAEQVYKTIVFVDGQHNHYVFCVPAQFSVNLKKARALTGQRDLAPIKVSQLKEVTGYIRGGCSPIGMKRPYPTYIDELCQLEEVLYISAGERGQQICLNPQDLIDICNATLADVT